MTVTNFEIARKRPDSPAGKSRHSGHNAKAARNHRFESPAGNASADTNPQMTSTNKLDAPAEINRRHVRGVQVIREELAGVYLPQSPEETRLVECLAVAQVNLEEARHALEERLRWQKANIGELYDRGHIERFRADLKAWRIDPHSMRIVFGQTYHSASFLSDLWNTVEVGLDSPVGLTFEQIKNVILSQCGDWRVDRLDVLRGRLMSWFLAIRPDAEKVIERWVSESRAGRTDIGGIEEDFNRARVFLAAAPPAEDSRKNLKELAAKEYQAWSARAQRQFEAYLRERARFMEVTPPHPLGDASDVRETRRIQRALATAENRFDKLERRLLKLLENRNRRNSSPWPDSETLRPCAIETTVNAKRLGDVENEMTSPRNEPDSRMEESVPPGSDTESDAPNLSARRPDPKKLAKAWRSKHGQKSRAGKRSEIVRESTVRKVDDEEAAAHS